jgi:hypothetical protein
MNWLLFYSLSIIRGKATGSLATLCCSTQCTENSKQIFPERKLRGLVPNFYIHVCVSDSYIPMIGPPILLYCVCGPIVGILYINCSQIHECRNWERGRAFSFLGILVSTFRYSAFAVHECRGQHAVTGTDKIWGLCELSTYAGYCPTPSPPIASTW